MTDTQQQAHTFTGPTQDNIGLAVDAKDQFQVRKMVEIYHSVKGEGTQAGMPMVFCRYAGCNLACSWCDTAYGKAAFRATDKQLLDMIMLYNPAWVVFTGGEPMLQLSVDLVDMLHDRKVKLACESNGQVWSACLEKLDYVCFSPKREVKAGVPTKWLLNPSIVAAARDGKLRINELRYVVMNSTDSPELVEVPSEYITFSPLMLDPEPVAGFESGDGYRSRFGKVDAGAYNRCLELVNIHRHRNARLSVQLHKFIGVR